MSLRGDFTQSFIGVDLKRALEAVHAQIADGRSRVAADKFVIRLRASVLTGKRDFLVTACVYFWLAAALTGVSLPELLRRAGRDKAWFRRQFVEAGSGQGVTVTPAEVSVELNDPAVFSIRYERLPFLSVVSLLIVEMLGYERLEQTIAPYLKRRSQETMDFECRRLCNDLTRRLATELPARPDMQRFAAILTFLESRYAERTVSPRDVSDDDVFDFWREWAARKPDIGVRLFESVRESFTRFLVLWSVAETAAVEGRAMTIDDHPEWGFGVGARMADDESESGRFAIVSAMALFEADDADDEASLFLEAIERSPLKIVVATKLRRLTQFMGYPAAAEHLHRTRARANAFDNGQRRVAAAAAKALPRSDVLAQVDASDITGYDTMLDELSTTLRNVESALWGCVHILKENRDPGAVDLAVSLSDSKTMQEMARRMGSDGTRDATLDGTPDIDEVLWDLRAVVTAGRRHAALDVLFNRAEDAFSGIKREGFQPGRVREPEVVSAARALADSYHEQIATFWRRHAQLASAVCGKDRHSAFEQDLRMFRQAFADLYAPQE